MTICIYKEHKPTGYKRHELHQPVPGTVFDEVFVHNRLLETLANYGIGPDRQPIELIDMAKYESENWIIQVIMLDGLLQNFVTSKP